MQEQTVTDMEFFGAESIMKDFIRQQTDGSSSIDLSSDRVWPGQRQIRSIQAAMGCRTCR